MQHVWRAMEDLRRRLKAEKDEAERKRLEEERRRLEAAQRALEEKQKQAEKERKLQQKLREIGKCCMGYSWLKTSGGYVCAGGSHYVSNGRLGL